MEQIYSFPGFENELHKLKHNSFLGNLRNSNGFRKEDQTVELSVIEDSPTPQWFLGQLL